MATPFSIVICESNFKNPYNPYPYTIVATVVTLLNESTAVTVMFIGLSDFVRLGNARLNVPAPVIEKVRPPEMPAYVCWVLGS